MDGQLGDFLGFTYNNVHSSQMGITRISGGTSYSEPLLANSKDESISITGNDGGIYFNTKYSTRSITVQFAFAYLTEQQIQLIKNLFYDRTLHPLIFDERPYIQYMARVNGTSTIKHICKEEEYLSTLERHYYGEGSLNFICYYPYGLSRYEYLDDYTLENVPEWVSKEDRRKTEVRTEQWAQETLTHPAVLQYDYGEISGPNTGALRGELSEFSSWISDPSLLRDITTEDIGNTNMNIGVIEETSKYINIDKWSEASGIPQSPQILQDHNYSINNIGDTPIPILVWFYLPQNEITLSNFDIVLNNEHISANNIKTKITNSIITQDYFLVLDTRRAVLEGYNQLGEPTGNIYNEKLTLYQFNTIPIGQNILNITGMNVARITFHYQYV